ncbi:MAG: glycosyltransferase [Candidatus Levybacteria bacterium]|nr:glycosyltransferase [Candidatus Levybacteria bacterium]
MNTKRLAVILYHTCPLSDEIDAEIGGANTYVLELSKSLAKKGQALDVYTRLQDTDSPRIVQVTPSLRVIHLPAGDEKALSKKLLIEYIPEFLKNFYAFMEKEKLSYSVVSCHYYLSGIIGLDIKKTLGIPMIMTFHTLGLMKNLVARSDDEREGLERIQTEIQLVKEADQIIATSEADAQYIETLYSGTKEKISILIPGVNLQLFKPMDKKAAKRKIGAELDHKMILFVGRIEPLKGIDVLLYAMKILLNINPDCKVCVWIVGGDVSKASEDWSKELQKLNAVRKVLGITTSVKFIGRKEPVELPDYYNAADLLVLPSHYESFGITAVEAMACGVPVITTDVAGVSDLLDEKHDFLITSANNPIMLAEKIQDIIENEEDYEKISHELSENVQDLSWDDAAGRFMKLCIMCSKIND